MHTAVYLGNHALECYCRVCDTAYVKGEEVSDIRAIGESEGYKRGQGQLLGTLRTAQDSREIRQNPTNNEHDHRNIEHFI
jgi:hypothetical protein